MAARKPRRARAKSKKKAMFKGTAGRQRLVAVCKSIREVVTVLKKRGLVMVGPPLGKRLTVSVSTKR